MMVLRLLTFVAGTLSRWLCVAIVSLYSCSDGGAPLPSPDTESVYGPGWSATHADGSNSDYSGLAVPSHVSLSWMRKFEGTINLGPSYGEDGTVYITTSAPGCHLYALDGETGETKWCNDELNEFAVASGVLVDKDQRLFIADDRHMLSLDQNGNTLWKASIDGFPFSAQFTHTGRLIFITHIGTIYVLDRSTGRQVVRPKRLIDPAPVLPQFDPIACMRGTKDCPCANTPAIDTGTGNLYFTFWFPESAAASVVAMRYSETQGPHMEFLWRNDELPGGSASSPDISSDGNTVYVNDNVSSIHAIDRTTGTIRWSYDIGYAPGGSQSTSPEGLIFPGGGSDAKLMCIRDLGQTATLVWRSDSLENRGIVTQCKGGLALATVKTGLMAYALAVVDVDTGEIVDYEQLPGKPLFSVGTTVGKDGAILVPTFNGYLYAFGREE